MKNKIRKANYFIGSKYYRYISDTELEVLRISRIKNENQVVAIKNIYKTDKTPELINKTTWDVPLEDTISFEYLSMKDLKDKYTKLLSEYVEKIKKQTVPSQKAQKRKTFFP